ncbi:MAG TPA: hypothetical protein VEF72_09040 [Mycobacterium sp.]|nr:hypothetical protein [Mycobacterium sp.]
MPSFGLTGTQNLNTSAGNYARICSTHTFDDRTATVADAKVAGLSTAGAAQIEHEPAGDRLCDLGAVVILDQR